jgi:hypothetical protein
LRTRSTDTKAMTLAITTFGAVLTTLLGVLVGSILSSRSQERQWSRDRQADACAQVLRESSNVLIEFARLIRQQIPPAPDGANVPTPMDWRPWNEALAMIGLVADHDIVEAAQTIDARIWPVHQQVKRGWSPDGGWLILRDPIEASRQDFVNIARKRLAAPGPPLRRLTGRPPSDDPLWQFRRSYYPPGNSLGVTFGTSAHPEPENPPAQGSEGTAPADRGDGQHELP